MALLADQTFTLAAGEQRNFGGPLTFVFFRQVAAAGVFVRFDLGTPNQSGEAESNTNYLFRRAATMFALRNSTGGAISVRVVYGDGQFDPGAAGAAVSASIVGTPDVNLASIQAGLNDANRVPVKGGVAAGSAIGTLNPVAVGGTDGTNARTMLTDTSGRPVVVGPVAAGAAITGAGAPVWVGGSDGTNVRALSMDTSGRAITVGPAAEGAALVGNPLRIGGTDGANIRTLAVTTAGLQRVHAEVSTGGGMTRHRLRSAATTNATSVKASAGKVYSLLLSNNSAAAKWFRFYDKASAPTVGTDTVAFSVLVPAGQTITWNHDIGMAFTTGIAYAITGAEPDTDTTAVAAGDVHVNLGYV